MAIDNRAAIEDVSLNVAALWNQIRNVSTNLVTTNASVNECYRVVTNLDSSLRQWADDIDDRDFVIA